MLQLLTPQEMPPPQTQSEMIHPRGSWLIAHRNKAKSQKGFLQHFICRNPFSLVILPFIIRCFLCALRECKEPVRNTLRKARFVMKPRQTMLSCWSVKEKYMSDAKYRGTVTAKEEIKMQMDIWSVIAIAIVVIGFFGGIWYEHK